jgi:hypothetical protein
VHKINHLFFFFLFLNVLKFVVQLCYGRLCQFQHYFSIHMIWQSVLLVETIRIHGKISLKSLTSLCRFIFIYLCPFISCKSNRPQFCYFWGIRQVTLNISMLKIACWLLINVKWAIFQPYHGENKIHFHERSMMSALYQANRLSLICIVLQQSAGRHLSTGTHYLDSEAQPV